MCHHGYSDFLQLVNGLETDDMKHMMKYSEESVFAIRVGRVFFSLIKYDVKVDLKHCMLHKMMQM